VLNALHKFYSRRPKAAQGAGRKEQAS